MTQAQGLVSCSGLRLGEGLGRAAEETSSGDMLKAPAERLPCGSGASCTVSFRTTSGASATDLGPENECAVRCTRGVCAVCAVCVCVLCVCVLCVSAVCAAYSASSSVGSGGLGAVPAVRGAMRMLGSRVSG